MNSGNDRLVEDVKIPLLLLRTDWWIDRFLFTSANDRPVIISFIQCLKWNVDLIGCSNTRSATAWGVTRKGFFHWGLLWQSNNGLSSDIGTHLLRFSTCDLARPWGRRTQTCLLMLTKGYLCVSMSSTDNVQKKNRWHVPLLYLYKSSDLTPRLYWNDPRDCETSKIRLFTDLHIPM